METQLKNIETRAGQPRENLRAALLASGLLKHGELRTLAQERFGLTYGDANALVHFALHSGGTRQAEGKSDADLLDELYSGPRAPLRPIHDALMAELNLFGEFEVAPKKGYLSLRRKKQFAMVGPATNARIEVGINQKELSGGERLAAQPAGGMCSHKVKLTRLSEVDAELISWLRSAFDAAG